MDNIEVPAILIIAYRRYENIIKILNICKENNVNNIYIAVDAPKTVSDREIEDNRAVVNAINDFKVKFSGSIQILLRDNNLGCALSVLSACDWVFTRESQAIILEDDCIPSADFFSFMSVSLNLFEKNQSIWLAAGSQFVPEQSIDPDWFLSKYPLIWGWATTKVAWKEIKEIFIIDQSKIKLAKTTGISRSEISFWNAGARRASLSFTDVWDTILVREMLRKNKYAVVPKYSYIENIGFDNLATNTYTKSEIVAMPIGTLTLPTSKPFLSPERDRWLVKKLYKIRLKHLFTPKITFLIDQIAKRKTKKSPLYSRFNLQLISQNKTN